MVHQILHIVKRVGGYIWINFDEEMLCNPKIGSDKERVMLVQAMLCYLVINFDEQVNFYK